jgi:hypothetical protein
MKLKRYLTKYPDTFSELVVAGSDFANFCCLADIVKM